MLASDNLVPTVIFSGPNPGGPLNARTPVGNWPGIDFISGSKLIKVLHNQATEEHHLVSLSNEFINQLDCSQWPFKLTTQNGKTLYALTVIIATGSTPKKLNIPGEEKYWNHGVSFDADSMHGKNIIVVGGGDDAMRKAHTLMDDDKNVTLLVRGKKLSAEKWRQKLIVEEGAHVLFQTQIQEIIGDGHKVTAVKLNSGEIIPTNGIVLAIGSAPLSTPFKDQLKLSPSGYILTRAGYQSTSVPGIFAAGEVVSVGQGVMASADGMKASYEALYFLDAIGVNDPLISKLKPKFYKPTK